MYAKFVILSIFLISNSYIEQIRCQSFDTEDDLKEWLLTEYEDATSELCNRQSEARWNYNTDIANAEKQQILEDVTLEVAAVRKQYWDDVFKDLDIDAYEDESLQRQLKSLKVLGNAALDTEKLSQLTNVQTTMSGIYSTAKICPYDNQACNLEVDGLSLEPGIESIVASSTDYDELVYVWKAWRDESGAQIKSLYGSYVDLSNQAAEANGYVDMGEMWRDRYETDNFIETLDNLWAKVKPLYDELHTYVRKKLQARYRDKVDMSDGLIPANILGNMWAQSWVNIEPYVRPYPDASEVDVTNAMLENDYTVSTMFEQSNEFYISMGLENNTMSYGEKAMIVKPEDREVLCHASAWDFCDGEDFRIKMCTNIDMEDFVTVHHEMGHIQYYLQYKDRPYTFRGGANPGFHEAVGDTIALSVATPQHLQKIGLLKDYEDNDESSINALMNMALERVAFLPFGYLIDKWRWDVFSGDVEESQWNAHWWEYRKTLQKVKAPIERSADDFDPGAKYHVAGNSQYINYFVAHILEFQLYKALCIAAGEYDPSDTDSHPLHKCDFYESREAGQKLRDGLSLGSSEHWVEALEAMTGERDLNAEAILEYFQPLFVYLVEQNKILSEYELEQFFEGEYAEDAEAIYNAQVHAEWNYATDISNNEKAEAQLQATLNTAEFEKSYWTNVFQYLDEDDYQQEIIKRQVKSLKVLGDSALEEEKLSQLTSAISAMTTTYSTARICPYANKDDCNIDEEGLSLDPGIEAIISTSDDYDELLYAWTEWRTVSGAKMKDDFRTYVDISNEAAEANGLADKGEMWRSKFGSDTFIEDVDELWTQVEPLYNELHTFVLNKLKQKYKEQIDEEEELIPAHLLGNMWAQNWNNLASLVRPYPDASEVDITAALMEKGFTVQQMFETANEFYTSLDLEDNSVSYNENAMIVKPEDRDVLCHASAWDFYDGEDFRIKMCTQVNYDDFVTIHHEMGHIQYYLLYKDLPITLRTGANPGFHEAVGDTIALSVATPQHFKEIGLLDDYEETEEASINALMDMALERVAFLPFGLLIDKWRWDVFSAEVTEDQWNSRWWYYRETLQKVKAPVERPTDAFDPGAKFHVAGDYQYISYFIAHILEFQLYKALCIEAGQYDAETKSPPLHQCDFYESTKAGDLLRAGLSLGSSEHWSVALAAMTGETKLDATAILEYFQPLYDYLQKQNNIYMTEDELQELLDGEYAAEAETIYNAQVHAEWNYATDVSSEEKQEAQLQATLNTAEFEKSYWTDVFQYLDEDDYRQEIIKRQVKSLKVLGDSALDEEKLSQLTSAISAMTTTYSTARICPYANKDDCDIDEEGLSLDPGIEAIISTSDDYDELLYAWTEWRAVSGAKMKDDFRTYVELSNEAAEANGFSDKGEMWRSKFESDSFIKDIDELWEQVEPLYNELHTFVFNKLKEKYEDHIDQEEELIPAHILGNMWAQSWNNLASLARPFPDEIEVDVTAALLEKDYSVLDMFQTANDFYMSLGLEDNSMSYNEDAMIIKPDERDVLCHASAWDFYDGEDFRIKMCTQVNYNDFITIHHEMGHIQYFLLYKDLPITLRTGANPGFHEAVGDTIALSVATPQHLRTIGLLDDYKDTYRSSINALMDMALERVAFLPFGVLIDKWRWDVFSGDITEEQWNDRWWHYRGSIQKVKSVEDRPTDAFDPGAKYHVAGDSQYISYFVAHILEFQLYKALCIVAGEYDPSDADGQALHKCDFFQNEAAGEKLRAGLSLGASVHWSDALEVMTGETKLDATAILEYFQPLYEYLKFKNENRDMTEAELQQFLEGVYAEEAEEIYSAQVHAEWNFETDVDNTEKKEAQVQATLDTAAFEKRYWTGLFQHLDEDDYDQELIKRQVQLLKMLGDSALEDEKLSELTNAIGDMVNIYSAATICPYETKDDCNLATEALYLNPGIENIMATSEDYDELLYAWTAWRNVSGAKMKEQFRTYVELSNEAADANGFTDKGQMWRSKFESDSFMEDIDKLWTEVEPLYKELHTFVLNKLKVKYEDQIDEDEELIPAHLLGNMWAQSWNNLASLVRPYPDASEVDITAALMEKGFTVQQMFETANEFYTSLGLEDNSVSYNEDAMIVKPDDRDVLCHASAWDFNDGETFRIKMCTQVNYNDFITIHHELGHIQYYLLYKDLPITLRAGANPGFHEAVGDTIALSVATPQHFKEIDLIDEYEESEEASINALMDMALERVAFLPFGLLIDKWRWDVFSGEVTEEEWNDHWWDYRETLQKVKAPVERTSNDFDPGAKFHVAADYQYISYFVAHILEFQFYKALCIEAGKYNPETKDPPLHQCDYYNSKEAGNLLRESLALGASEHWSKVLEKITGETEMSASALLEYFDPLYEYLKKANSSVNLKVSYLTYICSFLFVYFIPRLM